MHPLVRRQIATQKTLNKYRGKPFEWGKRDCIHMARTQLVNMGRSSVRIPRYGSEKTALRRLYEIGYASVEDALADYCLEVPASLVMMGDLATVKGDGALSAVILNVGQKWIGFPAETGRCEVIDITPDRVFRV